MRVHHIAISVKDSEKSASFYKDNFSFKEINRFTKPRWDGKAIVLQLKNLQLEIFQFQKSKKSDTTSQ